MSESLTEGVARKVAAQVANKAANSTGWWYVRCPVCSHPRRSMSVNCASGYFKCWRASCGYAGWATDAALGEGLAPILDEEFEFQIAEMPTGFVALEHLAVHAPPVAYRIYEYLTTQRKMTWDTAVRLRFGYVAYNSWFQGPRLIIPVLRFGVPGGWMARDISGWMEGKSEKERHINPKYINSPGMPREHMLYNEEAVYHDSQLPLILVEGAFKAIPHFPHTVACFGKPTDTQVAILTRTHRPIVVALDGNAWQEGWATSRRLRVNDKVAANLRLPPGKDPDDFAPDEFMRMAIHALKTDT